MLSLMIIYGFNWYISFGDMVTPCTSRPSYLLCVIDTQRQHGPQNAPIITWLSSTMYIHPFATVTLCPPYSIYRHVFTNRVRVFNFNCIDIWLRLTLTRVYGAMCFTYSVLYIRSARASVQNHGTANVWPWQLNRLEHSAWIRRLMVRVPLRSRHFLFQKLCHFHKNTRSCIENECCCPCTANISNVKFTSKIYVLRLRLTPVYGALCFTYSMLYIWSKMNKATHLKYAHCYR